MGVIIQSFGCQFKMEEYERRVFLLLVVSVVIKQSYTLEEIYNKKYDLTENESGFHRMKRAAVPQEYGNAIPKNPADTVLQLQHQIGQNENKFNNNNDNANNMKINMRQHVQPLEVTKENIPFNKHYVRQNEDQPKIGQQSNPDQKKPVLFKLAESPECVGDVQMFCNTPIMQSNNFAVLDCLQTVERVSRNCQHLLWQYKRNVTHDERFYAAGKSVCNQEIMKFPDCQNEVPNLLIPCLVDHMHNTTGECHSFLNKMSNIIFSDFRLIYHFVDKCSEDISRLQCGRLQSAEEDENESPHSQGRTITCLYRHMAKVSPECKLQVLRIAELQADDYHLDKQLYFACRMDREQFCAEIPAGRGKIYDCLFKHKFEITMSTECRQNLVLRQQLIAEDVRVDKSFFMACKEAIKQYGCFKASQSFDSTKRAVVLLCLENAMKIEKMVQPECVAEMTQLRQSIMADYKITPEIMASCGSEIELNCAGGEEQQGKTIHCLMDLVKNKKQPGGGGDISNECKAELENLLQEADVGADYRIDRALKQACQPVVSSVCRDVVPGDARMINCLMEHLDTEQMTDECEKRLLEIQYFIVRDFRLDAMLYKYCRKDAHRLCHAPDDWHNQDSTNIEQGTWTIACLYRNMKNSDPDRQVSSTCKHEVRRTMRQRARSVSLEPEVEENCMQDLSELCSDLENYENGEEMKCLQDNYDDLETDCQIVIGNFTEDEEDILELDTILMKACTPMIKRFCLNQETDQKEEIDASEILECLILHKHHPDMREKCAAGVEHHQIISLKDFRFNHKFKEACKESAMTFCNNHKTKYEVVACLSEHVRNDTLHDREQRIVKECRRQLRFEVLQRGESIELDPELKSVCQADVKKFCSNIGHGNAQVIECLKVHQEQLEIPCHKLIFKREKVEAVIGDFGLSRLCAPMMKKYCYNEQQTETDVLDCLKRNKDEMEFDPRCRNIVIRRQIMESKDYRLNPSLMKNCDQDISMFCKQVIVKQSNDNELEGKVIQCLKEKFIQKKLSKSCLSEMQGLIKDAHLDIRQDPILIIACRNEIKTLCPKEFAEIRRAINQDNQDVSGRGVVEECLLKKFHEKMIKTKACKMEIARILHEGEVDVNIDPILHTACNADLYKYCGNIPKGEGRQMSCLLALLDDASHLSPDCHLRLTERKELWEFAAEVAPVESLNDLYATITVSPSRFYLTGILVSIIGVIFIIGISCGRVTKRVSAEMKNR